MNTVEVVDRGGREIVVFLSGDIDDALALQLRAAVEEVAELVQISGLTHAVVDMHRVRSLGEVGLEFLRNLTARGEATGFEVSFAALTGPAHRAIETAGWEFVEKSPPPAPDAGGVR
ncbi:STAS domain-containing protein [Phytoactinopolyspora mesophila]|uniref:STAS domain-containing protein n=1 Tax=Phytoactinopolyspora mesophila TaxID=2650750 RepID=A0A7K3M4Z7_9ACTN|nr:STAS domain-containing protein [Phytoactinopolyspora mesophila]NDL58117.1 STAS domain-containing protein [Phytoactinopolyspora mesophila]